jgi:hypothetical protein
MKPTTFALVLGLALASPLLAHSATPVRATKVRDGLSGPARQAFDRASELFSNENFSGARSEFERAQELSGDPRILYNVAVCDKSLHHYARAMTALEKSLAIGGATLPKAYASLVKDTITTLEPYVSTLNIQSSEAGAKVYLDDEEVGETPLASPLRVDVGDHLVSLKKTGFLDEPKKVRVTSGTPTELRLQLEPQQKRADVVVTANVPTGAHVLVDGTDLGVVPFQGVLEPGKHAITVRAPGRRSETRVVEIVFGKKNEQSFTLQREAQEARLRVSTGSDRDIVTLDGRTIGKGGFFGAVPAGEHTLRVSREDAQARTLDLYLRDNETRALDITLDEKKSGLPAWAYVVGGVVLAGATTTAVILGTRSPAYEGSSPGTLDPRVVVAGHRGGF